MNDFLDKLNALRIGSVSVMNLIWAVLIFAGFLVLRKTLMKSFGKAIGRTHLDGTLKTFLSAAVNVLLWALIVMIVADKLGIPMTSLVALFSVAGLALSLSMQSILENLFSGITILATRPFAAGDYVDIGGTQGTVKSVGLFYTTLLSYDGKVVRIPNGTVASENVTNFSAHPVRRVDLEICASYDSDPEDVCEALREVVRTTDGTVEDPAPLIGVLSYGDSSIKYALYVWVDASRFFPVKFAVTAAVSRVFKERGITMTYNHLNVHLDK